MDNPNRDTRELVREAYRDYCVYYGYLTPVPALEQAKFLQFGEFVAQKIFGYAIKGMTTTEEPEEGTKIRHPDWEEDKGI
jgi:hypothetical protein